MREAGRIGFPRKRTVAADHRVVREEPGQVQAREDATGRAAGLVGEDRQRGPLAQRVQRLRNSHVGARVIEEPRFVDGEEALERVGRLINARQP